MSDEKLATDMSTLFGYELGLKDGMLRAAEIASNERTDLPATALSRYDEGYDNAAKNIAADIRREAEGEKK